MGLIGICGFEGGSLELDNLTLVVGGISWQTDLMPGGGSVRRIEATNSATTGAVFGAFSTAVNEFILTGQFYIAANGTLNDINHLGWGQGTTALGWVEIQNNTLFPVILVNGSQVAVGSQAVGSIGTWVRLHIHVSLNAVTGFVNVYVDGDFTAPVVSFSGNTDPTAAGTADAFTVQVRGINSWDNIVAIDPNDATAPTTLNDITSVSVLPKAPDGDGTHSDWTAAGSPGGASDFNYIDEVPPVDGDYVQATATLQRSTYTFEDVTEGAVLGAKVQARVIRGDTAAGDGIRTVARQGGVDYDGAVQSAPSSGGIFEIWKTAPDGTAWDTTKFNGVEFGVESDNTGP